MPINALVGLMGSGKSYECVSTIIIKAILEGRTVVTNVDGINQDAIRQYCIDKHQADPDKLGTVRHCKNEDVHLPNFLPHGTDDETFVKPGDLVCIDEAYRFWGTRQKILNQHEIFFREHRHYVDPVTKVSCDLVLMAQDIGDLHRTLKVVVEVTFKTTKLKSVGANNTYRLEMWEGHRLVRSGRLSREIKTYKKEIFPLYSSYKGGQGKEMQVDSRQNIFNSKILWFYIFAGILLFSFAFWVIWRFFHGGFVKTETPQVAQTADQSADGKKTAPKPVSSDSPAFSERWRYVGRYMTKDGQYRAVVADGQGRLRIESPSVFNTTDMTTLGIVDGQRVTVWTGTTTTEVKK